MRKRQEIDEQIAFVNWCAWNKQKYKGLNCIHAHPNEGRRTKVQNGMLKAAGMRKGFPDIELPAPRSLFMEFKFGKGTLRPDQEEWRDKLIAEGHIWYNPYSCDEAIENLIEYYETHYPDLILL